MSTISVPLNKDQEDALDTLVERGVGASRADVMRKALVKLSEAEAVEAVLRAAEEPSIKGNLRTLAKKLA